jgi:serine/threonine protein kinase
MMHSIIEQRPDGQFATERGANDVIVAATVQQLLLDLDIMPKRTSSAAVDTRRQSGDQLQQSFGSPPKTTPSELRQVSSDRDDRERAQAPRGRSGSEVRKSRDSGERDRDRGGRDSGERGDGKKKSNVQYDKMLPRDVAARQRAASVNAADGKQPAPVADGPPSVVLEIESRRAPVRVDAQNREIPVSASSRAVVLRGHWQFERDQAKLVEAWLEDPSSSTVSIAVKQMSRPIKTKALVAWSKLRSQYVLPIFGQLARAKMQRIVMPFVSHGSLRDYLDRNGDDESERFQVRVLHNVAAALVYLHSKNIIHRDLAAHNVLLHRYRNDDQITALLAGFSLTREVEENAVYETANFFDVPLQPLAPEQLVEFCQQLSTGCRSTPATDVWAFGVLAGEILLPNVKDFYAPITVDLAANEKRKWLEAVHEFVARNCFTPIDLYADDLGEASPSLVALTRRCLQHNVSARPPIALIEKQLDDLLRNRLPARKSTRSSSPPPASTTTSISNFNSNNNNNSNVYSNTNNNNNNNNNGYTAPASSNTPSQPDEMFGSSEFEVLQREWIELEREFAGKMAALESYHSELCAQAFADLPLMSMVETEKMFAGVTQLSRSSNAFHQKLASANRDGSFLSTALAALRETKLSAHVTEFLKNELRAQQILSEKSMRPAKENQMKQWEAFQRFLAAVRSKPKVRNASLFELLATPSRHVTAQRRILARLEACADSAPPLRKELEDVRSPGAKEASQLSGSAVLQELKWDRSKMLLNDFDGRSATSYGAGNDKHSLLLASSVGIRFGTKKPVTHQLLLFEDALLLCDKRRTSVVAAFDLSPAKVLTLESRGTTGFRLLSVDLIAGTSFPLEVVCAGRSDALQWCDAIQEVISSLAGGSRNSNRR